MNKNGRGLWLECATIVAAKDAKLLDDGVESGRLGNGYGTEMITRPRDGLTENV